jgi:hypothetical protein
LENPIINGKNPGYGYGHPGVGYPGGYGVGYPGYGGYGYGYGNPYGK